MTSTQTEPQALTIREIEALEWQDLWNAHPTWDGTVETPYGVAYARNTNKVCNQKRQ
jgi:hypothetical protein